MIKQPIKTWAYIDSYKGISHLSFDGEILWNKRHYLDQAQSFSPRKMLTLEECLTDYKTESAVLKYLTSSYKFDPIQFNQKDEKHWRFWRYLFLTKLPNWTLKGIPRYAHSEPFLEISTEGLRRGIFNFTKEKEYHQYLRLDNLFFYGPKSLALSLEDRKLLRQSILDALSPDANFSLQDAFPLLDYSKIPSQKWEYLDPNSSAGRSIEIHPSGYVTIEDWINPRDGNSHDYSFEEIWAKQPNFISQYDPEINAWIAHHFENAMI